MYESPPSPKELLQVLWKRLWLAVLVVSLPVGMTVGYSLVQEPMYEASVRLSVGQEPGITQPAPPPVSVADLQRLTQTMSEAVNSPPIAQAVIQQLDLQMTPEDLLERLSAEQIRDTQLLQISYRDPDPGRAQQVVDTVGEVFSAQVSETNLVATDITVGVWERAELPDSPVEPNLLRNGGVALIMGLGLWVVLAFLLEYLGDRLRSPEEVERISGAPDLGLIPRFDLREARGEKGEGLREDRADGLSEDVVAVLQPASIAAEAYRSLRTNLLLYSSADNFPKVMVLTSIDAGDGKSTTCANLGVVLSQLNEETLNKTLILDCDFRRPTMHKFFGMNNARGVVDVLKRGCGIEDVWQEPLAGLKVVAVGLIPPKPLELLQSQSLSELLVSVREEFDYVLINTSPLGLVSDPAVLAVQADGVLLILDAQNTRKEALWRSVRSLENAGANILGTVTNNSEAFLGSYYR